MRFGLGVLVLLGACAETPFVDTYAWDKDQLLIMYSPDRPQQAFYREAGAPGWTATASSTLEAPPPVAGIWRWNYSDWVVVDLGEGRAVIVDARCQLVKGTGVARLAAGLMVAPCGQPRGKCCSTGRAWVEQGGEPCPHVALYGPGSTSELCVSY